MSKLVNAKEELSLKIEINGKKKTVTLTPDSYYCLERNERIIPVIKHDALVRIADENGFFIDKTVLEFGAWNSTTNFCFIHRSFKTLADGKIVDEVGEANPKNLETAISAAYPAIMSNKRSQDRLLIRLMGLVGQVYSDVEFGSLDDDKEVQVSAPAASADPASASIAGKDKKATSKGKPAEKAVEGTPAVPEAGKFEKPVSTPAEEAPVASKTSADEKSAESAAPASSEETDGKMTVEEARALIVDYGAKFAKNPVTLGELMEKFPDNFKWLLENKTLSSAKMKKLQSGAELLAAAEAAK